MAEHREVFAQRIRESDKDAALLLSTFQEVVGVADNDKKSIFEQSFRDEMYRRIVRHGKAGDVSSLKQLVLLAVRGADQGVCYHTVPFLLLADALDCVTLDVCERLFDLIESHVTTWTQPLFFSSGKILLLRMCNDLLRRLSSAQNIVFCGRIQLFLSRLFPLSEKSALNLMSHFNLENVTIYNKSSSQQNGTTAAAAASEEETDAAKPEAEEGEEDMDIEGEIKEAVSGGPVDFNLYQKLWSLQDFFRQPTHCFSRDQWKVFVANVQEVLQAFASYKLEEVASKKKEKKVIDYKRGQPTTHYFAKYLTSEKLMSLQLNDSHFRRHVLIQLLILFQYLKVSVKFKSSSQVLSDSQAQLVSEMTSKVYQLLEETPPDGRKFADYIRHALKREETWIGWKNDGCPSYERSQQLSSEIKQQVPLGQHLKDLGEEKDLGSNELSRLWNLCPDNLEACSSMERMFVPSVDVFLEDAIDQADPKSTVPAADKLVNTPNFSWQALRILSHKSPHFFHPAQAQIKPLGEFLESVIIQTAKTLEQQQQQ